jgi:Ni,Fe-hydrogenase III large subunit
MPPHSHTTCYVQALEEIGGIQPPERALYLRTLIFELERIHSHLFLLGVMAYEVGFDTLFMFAWHVRESVLDLFEKITGNPGAPFNEHAEWGALGFRSTYD